MDSKTELLGTASFMMRLKKTIHKISLNPVKISMTVGDKGLRVDVITQKYQKFEYSKTFDIEELEDFDSDVLFDIFVSDFTFNFNTIERS